MHAQTDEFNLYVLTKCENWMSVFCKCSCKKYVSLIVSDS